MRSSAAAAIGAVALRPHPAGLCTWATCARPCCRGYQLSWQELNGSCASMISIRPATGPGQRRRPSLICSGWVCVGMALCCARATAAGCITPCFRHCGARAASIPAIAAAACWRMCLPPTGLGRSTRAPALTWLPIGAPATGVCPAGGCGFPPGRWLGLNKAR